MSFLSRGRGFCCGFRGFDEKRAILDLLSVDSVRAGGGVGAGEEGEDRALFWGAKGHLGGFVVELDDGVGEIAGCELSGSYFRWNLPTLIKPSASAATDFGKVCG